MHNQNTNFTACCMCAHTDNHMDTHKHRRVVVGTRALHVCVLTTHSMATPTPSIFQASMD